MATTSGSSNDETEDLFECALCLGTLKNPQMLPCVHNFCSECLESLHAFDLAKGTVLSTQLRCPTCRRIHLLPAGGVKDLPVDHRTNKMMSRWPSKSNKTSLVCFLCMYAGQKTEATSYCFNCTFPTCEECIAKHKVHPMHRDHLVKTFSKEALDDVLCKIHLNEVMCFFCLDCSAAVCHICISNEHKDHKFTGDTSSENANHSLGFKLKEQLCTIKDDIILKQSSVEEVKDVNDKCKVEALDSIDTFADHHIQQIENQRRVLKESTTQHHSMVNNQIIEVKTSWNKMLIHVTKLTENLNAMLVPLGPHNHLFPNGSIPLESTQGALTYISSPAMISVVKSKFNPSPCSTVGSMDTPSVQLTQVVWCVTQRNHQLQRQKLHVTSYCPEFGNVDLTLNPTKPWNKLEHYTHSLGDPHITEYIYKFIQSSTKARDMFTDIGSKQALFSIDWENSSSKGLFVRCFPEYKVQPKSKAWEDKCRLELEVLLSTITVGRVHTLEELFEQVVEAAAQQGQGQVYMVAEKPNSVIHVTGWEPNTKKILDYLNQMNQNLERNIKCTEETLKIKNFEGILLHALKYIDYLQKSLPNLEMRFGKGNELMFHGLPDEIKNAKLKIHEDILRKISSEKFQIPASKATLLKEKQAKDYVVGKFRDSKITAVMEIYNTTSLTIHAMLKDEVKTAHKIIQESIIENTLKLKPKNVPVLHSKAWRVLIAKHQELYPGQVYLEVVDGKKILIVSVDSICNMVVEEIKNCLDHRTVFKY